MSEEEFEEFEDLDDVAEDFQDLDDLAEWPEDYEVPDQQPVQIVPMPTFVAQQGTAAGVSRLVDELKRLQPESTEAFGYSASLVKDNLYHWHVQLKDFPKDSMLHKDMIRDNVDHVLLEITFPKDYPFDPPFVRVVRPRFKYRTGHVTIGGAICTELLCRSGWKPVYSIENIVLQLKSAMVDPEGPGRLDRGRKDDYTMTEARSAFDRFATEHGWQ